MKRVCLWILAGMVLLLAGCATEDAVGRDVQGVSSTINDVPSRWTYVPLSAYKVAGSSSLGDTHKDILWMLHTDRDIAFYNEMIRTNSGPSDKGKGGTMWTSVDYDDTDSLRASSYQTDTRQMVTVKGVEIE